MRPNRGAADAGQFWIRLSELVLLYRFLSVFEAVVCASSIPLRISPRDAGKSNALGTTPMRLNQLPCGGTRTHDQDENDTRSMAALCQSLLRLRDASKAALIVVHHVRKSIGRDEIGRPFRGSSAARRRRQLLATGAAFSGNVYRSPCASE